MKKRTNTVNIILFIIISLIIISLIGIPFNDTFNRKIELTYNEFYEQLENDNIKKIDVDVGIGTYNVEGDFKKAMKIPDNEPSKKILGDSTLKFSSVVPQDTTIINKLNNKIEENNLEVNINKFQKPISFLAILSNLIFFGFLIFLIPLGIRAMKNQGKAFSMGNAKSKKIITSNVKFDDVAGYEEEKQELIEIVDFLRNPAIYKKMGARVPKGVLLVGPPGTGKTLIAKAVAGEAGVNFITQSGSEFVEMFVGVGASRARQLFADAKKNAPCIIFIDEIDAIGRRRGNGLGGGNDEKEQTLNQILIEMDGFLENSGIVVVAATNRADVLDPALLRPGRFDRQVQVNLPNVKEREVILELHAKKRQIADFVDLKEVAKNTSGFSGAQLENVVNEAAIVAVRNKKKRVDPSDISEAIDRVIMGPAKKSRKYIEEDKKLVAYHETGHVIVGLTLEDADAIQKVTIIPRGNAGGYAAFAPKEDRFNYSKQHLEEKIIGLLGGRASELVMLKEETAGAQSDLESATKIARSMVVEFGMSSLGIYQYQHREDDQPGYITRRYSDETAYKIDLEISKILEESLERAKKIVKDREEDVHLIAKALMEVETLERKDIDYLLKHRELPEILESDKYTEEEIKDIQDKEKKSQEEIEKIKTILTEEENKPKKENN